MTYSVNEMLKMQLKNSDGVNLVHDGTNKPYFAYELAEVYHQMKIAENVQNTTKSATKSFVKGHRKKMFGSQEVQKIQDLINEKKSNRQIAKYLKCDEKTIRNYRKLKGF